MQRAAVLWRASPGRLVAALFALMLAAAMAVGSGANFNATSANPGNIVTAGILSHKNYDDGLAVLDVSNIKPGETRWGSVKLENTGNVDGVFSVSASQAGHDEPAGKQPILPQLTFALVDQATNNVIVSGPLASLSSVPLGTWAPNVSHTYVVRVTMANTAGANGQDNKYMGSSVEVDLNWESTS